MTISERIEAGRRERRVLTRVSRAAWRLEQAERERTLVSARAEGISIRTLATAAGLSPSRVHQLVAADLARVAAVIDRIAADVDELARARRVQDLNTAAVLPDRRAERRRRLAEPDLEFRAFCARKGLPASSTQQLERAWDAWRVRAIPAWRN